MPPTQYPHYPLRRPYAPPLPGVYALIAPDGQWYVGQANDIKQRVGGYGCKNASHGFLREAIVKYGLNAFGCKVLEVMPADYEGCPNRWLYPAEKFWITELEPALNGEVYRNGKRIRRGQEGTPTDYESRLRLQRLERLDELKAQRQANQE